MSTTSPVVRIERVRSFPALRAETGATVVLVLVALFALRFILLAAQKYAGNAYGWDMAIYNQCISNIAYHGVPISTAYSNATINHFGVHFSPIYYLIAVFYRFAPGPVTLATLQILALALGALPLYLLVERRHGPWLGLLFAVGYLLNPITQAIGMYEFHEIAFFVPLMLTVLWAFDTERTKTFWIFFVLTLCIREDTASYLLMFGSVAVLTGQRRLGLQVMAISAVWLLLVFAVVMPWLRTGAPYMFDDRYKDIRHFWVLLAQPARWIFVAQLLITVGFLPLLARRHLLLLAPGLAFSLLSSFVPQYSIEYHYTSPIFPFLLYTALIGLERLRASWRPAACALMVAGAIVLGLRYGRTPGLDSGRVRNEINQWHIYNTQAAINAAADAIPFDASVRATNNLLARVSGRKAAYILPWGPDADYALVDYRPQAIHAPATYDQVRTMLREMLSSGQYGVVYGDDSVVLLGRSRSTERNPEFLARLGP